MDSIDTTIKAVLRKRPVLKDVLTSFSGLLHARQEAGASLELPFCLFFSREMAQSGTPILQDAPLEGLANALSAACDQLLPLLAAQQKLAPYASLLAQFYQEEDGGLPLLQGNVEKAVKIAEHIGLPSEVMLFSAEFIVASVLRALRLSVPGNPWDGVWHHGYCPVCGAYPSLAYLERPSLDAGQNPYILGGGGQRRLHCSLCGADWQFRRRVCPFCGEEGDSALGILKPKDEAAERLDYCNTCRTYHPTIDLREMIYTPDMDTMALGLLHLDLIAAERELTPLRPAFWNSF